jgi:hypothetical protein
MRGVAISVAGHGTGRIIRRLVAHWVYARFAAQAQTYYAFCRRSRCWRAKNRWTSAAHEHAMGGLLQPAIAHLGKAEHPLDDISMECSTPARTLGLARFFAGSTASTR